MHIQRHVESCDREIGIFKFIIYYGSEFIFSAIEISERQFARLRI